MGSRVTIQDVAALASVSKVTVSYVLNGRAEDARISTETKERVLAAANTLGYRANAIARMLVTQRSQTIALVFQYASYFSNWTSFIGEVMHGVCTSAVGSDFDLMLHTRAPENPDAELGILTDGRVDGVLLLRDGNDPVVDGLIRREFPAVLFFTRSSNPNAAFVDADNFSGGKIAANHLIGLGHKKIAMIRGSLKSVSSNDRHSGYRDALESAGIPINPKYQFIAPSPTDDLSGFREIMQSLDRPTAVFVWSDDVAYGVLRELRAIGLRVPQDVSVIGFDSLEQSKLCSPQLTSIRQPIAEMAKDAADMLIAMINGQKLERSQKIYPLSLDVRASTGPLID